MANVLEVDVTGLVIGVIASASIAAGVDSDTPDNLASVLPFARVTRQGGPNDGHRLDVPTMVIHGFGASRQAAQLLLMQCNTALRNAIGQVINGATISAVHTLAGPADASYENPGVAHAFTTLQLHVKDA